MVQTPEEKKRKAKDRNLRARYGVTLEQFEEILELQGGICPVCEHSDKVFCLDHNHKTLEVRGVVCLNCNLRVIGGARDQDYKLVNAAKYVTEYPARKAFPQGLFLEKNPPKKRRVRRARTIKRPRS